MSQSEPRVVMEVSMTPEQYISIKNNASWHGLTVGDFLVANAAGLIDRRGC